MPFSPEVKAEALIACGRRCCICHKFCGVRVECHHIVPEAKGGANDLANCIPLCLNCHAEVEHYNPQHPKGNKFSPAELKGHRDNWHRLLRESIITGFETPTGQPNVPAPEAAPKTVEVSEAEVLILTTLAYTAGPMAMSAFALCAGSVHEVEIARSTGQSLERAKYHLGEMQRKRLVLYNARASRGAGLTGYWMLDHEGRRFLVENNLID